MSYVPPYQRRVDAGAATNSRNKKAAQNIDPNSHALYGAAPPTVGTETGGNNSSQTLGTSVSEKLQPQRQVRLPRRDRRTRHQKVLELETQGPRPFRWWFARFLGLGAKRTKQPSPGPQRHGDQRNKPRKQGRG
ncbi:hypothetical protein CR513_55167, partial [Mucuna pruriens]